MSTELAIQLLQKRVEALERQLTEKSVENPKKPKDKKEKVKRNPTGYNLYLKETRPQAIDLLVDQGDETPSRNAMAQIGKMWKALSSDEQASWNDRARSDAGSGSETEPSVVILSLIHI